MPRPASSSASPRTETPVPSSASRISASFASCARVWRPLPGRDQPLAQRGGVDAAAVIGDLEHEQVAVLARADRDRRGRRACRCAARSSGGSTPCATALRRSCVIGSTSCSATALSNSVSSPIVRSSTRTPVARRSARSVRAAWVIRLRARLHADAREAALELADRAAQRLDLVEQRRGGLR